eukprot:jgi/Hompol1/3062/HPOL_000029-RA
MTKPEQAVSAVDLLANMASDDDKARVSETFVLAEVSNNNNSININNNKSIAYVDNADDPAFKPSTARQDSNWFMRWTYMYASDLIGRGYRREIGPRDFPSVENVDESEGLSTALLDAWNAQIAAHGSKASLGAALVSRLSALCIYLC